MNEQQTKFWFACVDGKVARDPTLSPFDKAVFLVLCSHADTDNRECYLKVKTIAYEAGCSERSTQKSLKTLTERGIIERKERFEDNRQLPSLYRIIGEKAPCYAEQGCPPENRGAGDAPGGCTTCTQNENLINDIKDSLTGEAELPDVIFPLTFEDGEPVIPSEPEKPQSSETPDQPEENPEETCTPEQAPDIMLQTARYMLDRTGRKGLTWEEILALRALSDSQYPSRVQKEIDTAVKRFRRKGRPLSTLTFGYIAGSLKHQPTRKGKRKTSPKPKPEPTPKFTDEDTDAIIAEIAEMQADFDKEAANCER